MYVRSVNSMPPCELSHQACRQLWLAVCGDDPSLLAWLIGMFMLLAWWPQSNVVGLWVAVNSVCGGGGHCRRLALPAGMYCWSMGFAYCVPLQRWLCT